MPSKLKAEELRWTERFNLSYRKARNLFHSGAGEELLRMLDGCADDSARRILLGVGERFDGTQKEVKRFTVPKRKPVRQSVDEIERMLALARRSA